MASKEKNTVAPPDFGDTRVIGINSAIADYKLVWLLNEKLSIKLSRQDDFVHSGAIYPYYHCSAEENGPVYGLLAVSFNKKSSLNFNPRLDYLFIIRNESLPNRVTSIFEKIKEISGINYAFLMDSYMDRLDAALYDVEDYDTIILTKARELKSPEHVKEEIRQRNIILGISEN